MTYLLFIVGLLLLLAGGEVLVRGAVGLALKMKVSNLVIGATVVSLGTSAPELLVSLQAALDGHPVISIGNVVGSNIANLGLVLGLIALIFPLTLDRDALYLDWPVMFCATLLFFLMAYDGVLERYEGALLVFLLVLYITYSVLKSRKRQKLGVQEDSGIDDLKPAKGSSNWKLIGMVILGSAGLMLGAKWFVDGAIVLAEALGVSEHIISVTVVAFGTSVPELATSGVAAFKKQSDISVGNLIGSNTFNILAILGITSLVKDIPVSAEVLSYDMLWVIGIALLLLVALLTGKKVFRLEGAVLFTVYGLYIYFSLV